MRSLIVLRKSKTTIECSGCPSYGSERIMDLVWRFGRVQRHAHSRGISAEAQRTSFMCACDVAPRLLLIGSRDRFNRTAISLCAPAVLHQCQVWMRLDDRARGLVVTKPSTEDELSVLGLIVRRLLAGGYRTPVTRNLTQTGAFAQLGFSNPCVAGSLKLAFVTRVTPVSSFVAFTPLRICSTIALVLS